MFALIRITSEKTDQFNKVQRYFFNSVNTKKAPQIVRLLKYLILG
jgi:hypothetical protein